MKINRGAKIFVILFFYLLAIGLSIILFINHAHAEDSHILISEIYPNPSLEENEWIELFNPTNEEIDLSLFSIEDGTGSKYFLTGLSILPQSFLVLEEDAVFSFGLNNNGDKVSLNMGEAVVDQVSYGEYDDSDPSDNARCPNKGRSIARDTMNSDSDVDVDDFFIAVPTKGGPYIIKNYNNYDVFITEILPHPKNGSEHEYIEIYNNNDTEIDLGFWELDDVDGGSSPYLIPENTIIEPNKFLVFYNVTTHVALNNNGDSVRLIDPNGNTRNMIKYDTDLLDYSIEGLSYSLGNGKWWWSMSLTPDKKNIITAYKKNSNSLEVTIDKARKIANGQLVKVEGRVSVLPQTLSSRYFYIQDQVSGIQVYSYNKNFPKLDLGDLVLVWGELSESNNEKRIKIKSENDILVINKKVALEPLEVKGDISEKHEGRYVKIKGSVSKTSGNTFYVSIGKQEIQVKIYKTTGIKKPKMRRGDKVEICGIVSQYKNYYRILPTKQKDVKIISSGTLPRAGADVFIIFYIVVAGYLVWNIYQTVKKKLIRLHRRSLKNLKAGIFIYYLETLGPVKQLL